MESKSYQSKNAYTANDDVRLSEPISLIGELSKKINNLTSDNARTDTVPKGMKLVLQCLMKNNGVTQLDIVKFTGFKAPTISIMIQKMEASGYVTRTPDENDLRAMRVFITESGKKIYYDAVMNVKHIEGKVLRGISENEQKELVKILSKIKKNL